VPIVLQLASQSNERLHIPSGSYYLNNDVQLDGPWIGDSLASTKIDRFFFGFVGYKFDKGFGELRV
jgi:hypothetical protein